MKVAALLKVVAGILGILAIGHLILIGLCVGEGYLLHWLLPGMDVGSAILAGTAFVIASLYFVVQFIRIASSFDMSRGSTKEAEEDEEDEEDDEEEEPRDFFLPPRPSGPRRRRRKRRR